MSYRKSERTTYEELTRLAFGQLSGKDSELADFAINTHAMNLARLRLVGPSFLSADNQQWLEAFFSTLGKADFVANLDPLSQAVISLKQTTKPDKSKARKTPLDELEKIKK